MRYFSLLFAAVAGAIASPRKFRSEDAAAAPAAALAYKLKYDLYYLTAGLGGKSVTNDCGEYYARTFLHNLIGLSRYLDDRCVDVLAVGSGGEGGGRERRRTATAERGSDAGVRVHVYPVVVVTIRPHTVSSIRCGAKPKILNHR